MCSIKLPPTILDHIDNTKIHYLWNTKSKNGHHCKTLIAWDKVCWPKKKGGMGVVSLRVQNEALLLKYVDTFYNRFDTPWVHLVLNSKYLNRFPHVVDTWGSFWWK